MPALGLYWKGGNNQVKPEERIRREITWFMVLVGILVLVNLISIRTFFRLDLTKHKTYSLSKISKQYMRDLKDPLTVKAFFTKNLPPPYNTNARYLRDLLQDYRAYARGRFNYQFIDPANDPSIAKEARSLGVYQIQLTAIAKDKFEQKNGYMGVALIYQGRKEVIPLIQDISGLEYQITSTIKHLLQTETKVVGITQGYGEPGFSEELENIRQLLSKNFEIVPVDLSSGGIPEKVDALIVAGPTQTLPEEKLYILDQFLRAGKNMAVLICMVKADAKQSMQGRIVISDLTRLLSTWGVKLRPNLVYDSQCQRISVAQRGPGFIMQNIVPYPPFPLVTEIDRKHLINKNIESITLPFVSSLDLDEGILKKHNLQGNVLAKSSAKAWSQQQYFMLSPQFIMPPQPDKLEQFNLIGAVTGAFPSAFSAATVPEASAEGEKLPAFLEKSQPARLLVVGGVDFITNDFIDTRRGGQGQLSLFAQNMVDWVAQDAALIEIRSKDSRPAPLTNISEAHRRSVKYFNLVGLPILVILVGLGLWRRMETRRLHIAAKYRA